MRSQVKLQVAVAVLSFVGATAGVFISARFEEARADRDNRYSFNTTLLNKRIELVERTAKILNRSDAASQLAQMADLNLKLAGATTALNFVIAIQRVKADKKDPTRTSDPGYLEKYVATKLQLDEINVEFGTVMVLDKLYFGMKTQKAIDDLVTDDKAWWGEEVTGKKRILLTALFEDLPLGLEERFRSPIDGSALKTDSHH